MSLEFDPLAFDDLAWWIKKKRTSYRSPLFSFAILFSLKQLRDYAVLRALRAGEHPLKVHSPVG